MMKFLTKHEMFFFNKFHTVSETKIYSEESIFSESEPTLDVSIVIPCYNAEKYLSACLDSLCQQETSCAYEIVAVDDGSTDQTAEILEQYAQKFSFLRVLRQKNGGPGRARTNGMRSSLGKYLLFIDADDHVSKNYVEELYSKAIKYDADLVGCSYQTVTESGTVIKKVAPKHCEDVSCLNGTPWAKLFRRSLFEHLCFPENIYYQDTIIAWLVFPQAAKKVMTANCSYAYLSNQKGITISSKKTYRSLETMYITDMVFSQLEKFVDSDWFQSREFKRMLIEQLYINQLRVRSLERNIRKMVFWTQSRFIRELDMDHLGIEIPYYDYLRALKSQRFLLSEKTMIMDRPRKAWNAMKSRFIHRKSRSDDGRITLKKKRKLKLLRNLAEVLLFLMVCSGAFYYYLDYHSKHYDIVFYEMISEKVNENLRIVFVSDLHMREYGDHNDELVEDIRSVKPDLILLGGDMVTYPRTDYENMIDFCEQIVDIAPVYAITGNHENELMYLAGDKELKSKFEKSGISFLDNEDETLKIGKNKVQLVGINGGVDGFVKYGGKNEMDGLEEEFDGYRIVMDHVPAVFEGEITDYNFDLALAGHVHGGIARIPKFGGFYSFEEGFFPDFAKGRYSLSNGASLIVSGGLGDSLKIFSKDIPLRIMNNPELLVIDINWY